MPSLRRLGLHWGPHLARSWLADAAMQLPATDGPVLVMGSRFKADYVRQTFAAELDRAAATSAGLAAAPMITVRPR